MDDATDKQCAHNYAAGGQGVVNQNQFDVRIDEQLSTATHLFGRYSYFGNIISAGTLFGPAGGTGFSSGTSFGGSATGRDQSGVAGMDVALRPNLLTDFRIGYLRITSILTNMTAPRIWPPLSAFRD